MKKLAFAFTILIIASCGGNNDNNAEKTPEAVSKPEKIVAETMPGYEDVKKEKPAPKVESHTAKPDSDVEAKILDFVLDLPEVKKENERIEKISNGNSHLSTMIGERPSDDAEFYTVKVGENTDSRFVTHHLFHVYPDKTVMVYDPVKDEEISLRKWSKSLK